MRTFIYIFGLFLSLALQLRAIQLYNTSNSTSYMKIGDKISAQTGKMLYAELNSFIDLVSKNIVNKLEDNLSNDNFSNKMMVLLQNDGEIFDLKHYKNHDIALIQSMFFNKIKDKFNNSYLGQKIAQWKSHARNKISKLYEQHKHKIHHFFQIILKSLIFPIAFKFIKENLGKWKKGTLDAANRLDKESYNTAYPIINGIYDGLDKKFTEYYMKNKINFDNKMDIFEKLEESKKEIESIEKEEEAIEKEEEAIEKEEEAIEKEEENMLNSS